MHATLGGPSDGLAVDVQRVVVVEELRTTVEDDAARRDATGEAGARQRRLRRSEEHRGLRLRQEGAEEARDRRRIPSHRRQHPRHAALHRGADARRLAGRREVGVGVAALERDLVAQEVEERRGDLLRRGGAEADRVGRALVDRDAIVRILRRQVQHVTGREHLVVPGREPAQDLEGHARHQREVVLAAVAPASPAEALQQEHVVRVEVRADAASRHGVAHHQVVEPRERQEGEAAQERIRRIEMQVETLHQQGPVARRQSAEVPAAKRTVRERPAPALAHHQPRLDVVAHRKPLQRRGIGEAREAGDRGANESRLLLPVPAQEGGDG